MAAHAELTENALPYTEIEQPNSSSYPDWDDFRVLLTVVRMGSFKRAAEALGTRQPTVSRRIARLEEAMGTQLVERSNNGASLTLEGQRILHELNIAHGALQRALDRTHTRRSEIQDVNVLVTDGFATYWLSYFLSVFFDANPDIALRILTVNDATFDKKGHIDLAIHYFPPNDVNAVMTRLGTLHFVPYAAPSYLEKFGTPRTLADLSRHRLSDQILHLVDKGSLATLLPDGTAHDRTQLYSNSSPFLAESVRRGASIGMVPSYASVFEKNLVPIEINFHRGVPFWLCYRRESLAKTSVQRVIAFLRHVVDQHAMPWFGERYISPSKFGPTTVAEIMHGYDPVASAGPINRLASRG